jgi:hypothetical protein
MNRDEFINLTKYDEKVVDIFLKKHKFEELFCKCGKPKNLRKINNQFLPEPVFRIGVYCGFKRCNKRFGVLRPEHSKLMTSLAKSGSDIFKNSLIKKGEHRNKEVNKQSFLRTKLTNRGIDITNCSDEEIKLLNNTYESNKFNNNISLSNRIFSFILKESLQETFNNITKEQIISMSTEDPIKFEELKYKWRSWHHIIYCQAECGAKHFKKGRKDNLKFNFAGKNLVVTRSSYESNYIDFFEKEQIMWDYEPFRIELEKGTYLPDFIFKFNGMKYLVEVKGYLLERNKVEYMKVKMNQAFEYAKKHGMEFIFTYDSKPKSIEELINQSVKEKF